MEQHFNPQNVYADFCIPHVSVIAHRLCVSETSTRGKILQSVQLRLIWKNKITQYD